MLFVVMIIYGPSAAYALTSEIFSFAKTSGRTQVHTSAHKRTQAHTSAHLILRVASNKINKKLITLGGAIRDSFTPWLNIFISGKRQLSK
jgi:hypothetical protein